ncbi:MAG: Asp-tRNA(Asn)/Glu-tRNA(Gln) amidotransferase subunit GatC [Chloroflexota bacterium]
MTTITPSEVQHIAHLARLKLSDEEVAHYSEQLSAILEHFVRLQTVTIRADASTETAIPTALRPDIPRPGLLREDLLRNAPAVENEQFRIPPVFE